MIASRICAAAHGEQVVVSRATRDMAGEEPLPGSSFRKLGRHRLKDVPDAAQLFQLRAPQLREYFPPLKTLSATSLPALHHRLVGRDDALAHVERLLATDSTRLVTITGPGGAGKSRLALEVAAAAALERPVHLVGLAPVSDVGLVPGAIARPPHPRVDRPAVARGDRLPPGWLAGASLPRQPGAPDTSSGLRRRAPRSRARPTGARHQPHATPALDRARLPPRAALHRGCHNAIRRARGRTGGDPARRRTRLRARDLPPPRRSAARDRASGRTPRPAASAEIVRALERGLALEMEGPMDLPERQRTLRAAIDWSYVASPTQRALHGTLAVFLDGAMLEDACALAPDPLSFLGDLEALVGWSLVRSEASDGSVRLSMLETVREHALGRLEAEASREALRERHAERFLELALSAEAKLSGPDRTRRVDRLERELDNIRLAIDWLLASGRVEDALQATAAPSRFWRGHGHMTEARRLLAVGLERAQRLLPRCAPTTSGRRTSSGGTERLVVSGGAARAGASALPRCRATPGVHLRAVRACVPGTSSRGFRPGGEAVRSGARCLPRARRPSGDLRLAPHSRGDPLDAGAA